jgi:hypothetical protein
MRVDIQYSPGKPSPAGRAGEYGLPIWVDPPLAAQCAAPDEGLMGCAAGHVPGGLAKRVCRKAKAQDFDLRASPVHRDAAHRLRLVKEALALHCGINL